MSETSDLLFQVAKANVEASQAAYQSGYAAGYKEGMDFILNRLDEKIKKREPLDAQPTPEIQI